MTILPSGSEIYLLRRLSHVSSREGHHGFKQWSRLSQTEKSRLIVKIDGREIKRCVDADARFGYVDYLAQVDGKLLLNPFKNAAIVHRLYGSVEITC